MLITSDIEFNTSDRTLGNYSDSDLHNLDLNDLELGIEYQPSDSPKIKNCHDWSYEISSSEPYYQQPSIRKKKQKRFPTPYKISYGQIHHQGLSSRSDNSSDEYEY